MAREMTFKMERPGLLHEGDKVTPVCGGSVTGTLTELISDVKLSKELRQYDTCLVPSVIKIENVTITGA